MLHKSYNSTVVKKRKAEKNFALTTVQAVNSSSCHQSFHKCSCHRHREVGHVGFVWDCEGVKARLCSHTWGRTNDCESVRVRYNVHMFTHSYSSAGRGGVKVCVCGGGGCGGKEGEGRTDTGSAKEGLTAATLPATQAVQEGLEYHHRARFDSRPYLRSLVNKLVARKATR